LYFPHFYQLYPSCTNLAFLFPQFFSTLYSSHKSGIFISSIFVNFIFISQIRDFYFLNFIRFVFISQIFHEKIWGLLKLLRIVSSILLQLLPHQIDLLSNDLRFECPMDLPDLVHTEVIELTTKLFEYSELVSNFSSKHRDKFVQSGRNSGDRFSLSNEL
jgi:hypothetical protein